MNRTNLPAGKPVQLSDSDLLEKARGAANGSKFAQLWDDDTSGYGSDSEADLALCSLLGFWCLGDQDQMDRLFRQSGLYRGKWDERHSGDGRTYGELTVAKALERATFYQGATNGHRPEIPVDDIVNADSHENADRGGNDENTTPILPESVWTGWLADYRAWVEPTTDGAIEAMYAFAPVDLSLGLGRHVAVQYGRPTWANLYVGAVGPTGVPRKSIIQQRGNSIRRQTFMDDVIRVARSIGSGEGLLERFCNEGIEGEGKTRGLC